MNKLTYEKWFRDEEVKGIIFRRDGNKKLDISFQGNLDLYFSFCSLNENDDDFTFLIGKDNYQVWEIFDRLYKEIINCKVFEFTNEDVERIVNWAELFDEDYHKNLKDKEEQFQEMNNNLKNSEAYKKLVNDGVITWRSDDYFYDIAPFFKIEKLGTSYLISFGVPEVKRELNSEERMMINDWRFLKSTRVRLRNSGSSYDPFNMLFMKAFNALMDLEETNQIHIEEYLIDKELEKGESLARILRK